MRVIILIPIVLIFLYSCTEDNNTPTPLGGTSTGTGGTSSNDTIIPYSINNCCDTTFTYNGQVPSAITLIPTAITPNGDGNNDRFYLETSSPLNEQVTLELFDSLGTLAFSDTLSSTYIPGVAPQSHESSYLGSPSGMFSARLFSSSWSVDFKLCVLKNVCTSCNAKPCLVIDALDAGLDTGLLAPIIFE